MHSQIPDRKGKEVAVATQVKEVYRSDVGRGFMRFAVVLDTTGVVSSVESGYVFLTTVGRLDVLYVGRAGDVEHWHLEVKAADEMRAAPGHSVCTGAVVAW